MFTAITVSVSSCSTKTLACWRKEIFVMYIDRRMVSLFFEIKRSSPQSIRKSLMISAPDIGHTLVKVHSLSNDNRLKNLIERFLELAGDEWMRRIKPLNKSASANFLYKKKISEHILNHH